MNREQYLNKRNELMTQAQNLINEGKIDEANAIMDSIKDLDKQFQNFATATANMNALKDNVVVPTDIQNMITGNGSVVDQTTTNVNVEKDEMVEDPQYHNAFLNHIMGKPLNNAQTSAFEKMNDGLSTTTTSIVIPQTTASKIWRKVGELYPLYNDVTKTNIKGIYKIIKEKNSSDAAFYNEDEETSVGTEELEEYTLSGCELSRNIKVSWKLKEMSMTDFEDYIVEKMAKKMGAGLGYSVAKGKGKKNGSTVTKDEPLGIITTLEAQAGKSQVVEYTTAPTYDDMTNVFSKVKSQYKKVVYATNEFIWGTLAKIVDEQKRPYFVPDATEGGVGRIFGAIVKEDDSIGADTMLVGDPSAYLCNFNKTVTLDTEEQKTKRQTVYIGYSIVDGALEDDEAFALLKKKG